MAACAGDTGLHAATCGGEDSALEAMYNVRELKEPDEIRQLLRLRHDILFRELGYGALKPLGLDLDRHDHRAQFLGVFRDDQLVGGLRIVRRIEQHVAAIVRGMRAVAELSDKEEDGPTLPSEEAFDLTAHLGSMHKLVDAEVGRLVILRERSCPGLLPELLVAGLAALLNARVRLYLFSCATERYPRFAAVTEPRWRIETARSHRISGFTFPRPTLACVAAPEDSRFFERALAYADELAAEGSILLCPNNLDPRSAAS